ncbi:hypothetical protein C5167_008433 [Papaver somniferum]|uniref:Uncharacterized protein n=1 Tax=Papaver somniferum TaxID=3469 RepID=A0A4Y7JYF9_PAPSO|nr:TPD1 protein homolog 1-like [Papaver somniferum]RZC64749.1 hypothetical protein C5167_008433 [Papaver somniferum]
MAAALNIFAAAVVVLSLIGGGFCQCELSNIVISQRLTGFQIHGQTEYEVSIVNDCQCTQSDVVIHCPGFTSTFYENPSIWQPIDGDLCSFNSGKPVFFGETIKFMYASDPPCALTPASSRISCS